MWNKSQIVLCVHNFFFLLLVHRDMKWTQAEGNFICNLEGRVEYVARCLGKLVFVINKKWLFNKIYFWLFYFNFLPYFFSPFTSFVSSNIMRSVQFGIRQGSYRLWNSGKTMEFWKGNSIYGKTMEFEQNGRTYGKAMEFSFGWKKSACFL